MATTQTVPQSAALTEYLEYARPHASQIITPYGGRLVDLLAHGDQRQALIQLAASLPSIQLSTRALCDLELLATGAFSPLDRFMGQADYQRVLHEMRLSNGVVFPIPITLTVDSKALPPGADRLALRDARNNLLGVMQIEELFEWDAEHEARLVLGTNDPRHPLVSEMARWGDVCISGPIQVVDLPKPYDFAELRRTPAQVRALLERMGHSNVVAFQTRNPLHRSHEELTRRAAELVDGSLLIHPSVGMTKPGDVDHYSRVRIYRSLVERYYDQERTLLSLLPLAMRMAGPREALWHAIIRRNFGASHIIIGRDHAGPGTDSAGKPFYGPYDAQNMAREYAAELGVTPLCFGELLYLPDRDAYVEADRVPEGARVMSLSGTQVRDDYLAHGRPLPEWFTRRETAQVLAQMYPPRHQQGFCLWFTGLSGAGKSTIAEIITVLLLERGRQISVLDGDVVRTHLGKGLGFSRADRDTNILRIGFVAGEIVRHGGVAICAAVSPYRAARNECRALIGGERFVEVFVDTPIEVCEERDVKGLYRQARQGLLKGFTGIDDPYEAPISPELTLDTIRHTPESNTRQIIAYLEAQGFVLPASGVPGIER